MFRQVFAAILLCAAWTSSAKAHDVTICGEVCSPGEQCNLKNDLSCNTNPAVTLNGGADFDFKGKKITCSGCSASANGILVTSSGTTIEDTGALDGSHGGLFGAWGAGINCQLNSTSVARNLIVDGAATGIEGCRKVSGVVVRNTTAYGISNIGIGSTDYIKNSYVFGTPTGVRVAGSGPGLVDHNVVASTTSYAILASSASSTSLAITSNTLYPGATGVLISTATPKPVRSGNVCGSSAISACNDCQVAGDCAKAETPFVGP